MLPETEVPSDEGDVDESDFDEPEVEANVADLDRDAEDAFEASRSLELAEVPWVVSGSAVVPPQPASSSSPRTHS